MDVFVCLKKSHVELAEQSIHISCVNTLLLVSVCSGSHGNIQLGKVVDDDSEKSGVKAQVRGWHTGQTKKRQVGASANVALVAHCLSLSLACCWGSGVKA